MRRPAATLAAAPPLPPSAAQVYDRTTTRWGQGAEMTASEAAAWHASNRPMLRAASVVVEHLDGTPPWERLVKGHAWAVGRVPRLRQRVVADPLRVGPPRWTDTHVDLDHHLRRILLAPGAVFADVLTVAAAMHEETFDPARPLWVATLVEGLPGGRAAFVLKLHHAIADDQAVVALFDLLHSHVREPTTAAPQLPPASHEARAPLALTALHALAAIGAAPLATTRVARRAGRAGRAFVQHPVLSAGSTARVARTLVKSVADGAGAGSPLLRARCSHRAFDAIEIPTEQLRAASAEVNGGVVDAMFAAVADGLGRYHTALGSPVEQLPIAVPLHVRFDGSGAQLSRARITVPTRPMPARERIAILGQAVATAGRRSAPDLVEAAAPVISRTPTVLVAGVMQRSARPLALQGFVVRGLQRDAFLAGARVERMFSFGPTAGCALSATLVTHQDVSCVGFAFDTAAVTHPALMGRCLRAGFSALSDHSRKV